MKRRARMACRRATYSNKNGVRSVTYKHDDGRTTVHEGGSKSWRNNNPGNLKGVRSKRIGVDAGGFDIYPDLQTGEEVRRSMFEPGGKYYKYDSIRDVLGGQKDKNGKLIKGTAYAPANDSNFPDRYADDIREWADIDVDRKKIADMTPEEKDRLLDAMKRKEGWGVGKVSEYDKNGKLIEKPAQSVPGSKSIKELEEDDYDDWGYTMSP